MSQPTWRFMLEYTAPPDPTTRDAWVEALGTAGGTDLLLGLGTPGRIGVQAERPGASAAHAIAATLLELNRVWPRATLCAVHVDGDARRRA